MLQLKHMNFKFSYLFLIRKPLQLHKSSLFQINITAWVLILRTFEWHSSHTLVTCASICKTQPWSHYTSYSYFPHLWTNSTSESVTLCSVMCHHILLTSAKPHLHMWIHRQVWMPGRSKEELPETTATWKQARKGNTVQWGMLSSR